MSKINFKNDHIQMSHGSGGRATADLVQQLFYQEFDNPILKQGNDASLFNVPASSLVVSTDSYVVSPLFFPGGNIGDLAMNGTINDVAMSGAKPLYLTAAFILEEGFPCADLKKIVQTMANISKNTGVPIIAGDTKVVERNKGDGVFINTTGIGVLDPTLKISGDQARPGDHIILSGFLGDHGVAIMSQRENLQFGTALKSDSAALHDLVATMTRAVSHIHCLRDPTRGGLGTSLNEIALQSNVGINIDENKIPIRAEVRSACELLGLDPLYIANEGKLIAICPPEYSALLLKTMQAHPLGRDAALIGEVIADTRAIVQSTTCLGGHRIVSWLSGEQLPRIC